MLLCVVAISAGQLARRCGDQQCGAALQNALVLCSALLVNVSTLLAGLITPWRCATEVGGNGQRSSFTSEAAVSASSQPLREWCRRPRGSMLFVKADESNSDAMGPSAVPATNLGVLVCGWLPKGVTSGRYATCCVRAPSALEKALDPVHGAVGARLSCHTPCTHHSPRVQFPADRKLLPF